MMTILKWITSLVAALFINVTTAYAGYQKEELLSYSVKLALSKSIASTAPPTPVFSSSTEEIHYLQWRNTMSLKLRSKIEDEWQRTEFLDTLWYESSRAGLDPAMVLGLIQVESNFRKYAVSAVGARGFMQVMPFWTKVIGDGDASKLFHMQTNLRYGCTILRHYIEKEKGNLFLALGRYNGSRGRASYPNAVYRAWKNWM